MTFNFDEFLNKGNDAADLVIKSNEEVDEVLTILKDSISRFLNLSIELDEKEQYEDDDKPMSYRNLMNIDPLRILKKTGYIYISITNKETGINKVLMNIKKSSEGYPIKIVHDKVHYSADNKGEFIQVVGDIVSNPQTNLMLRGFKRSVEEKQETLDSDKS